MRTWILSLLIFSLTSALWADARGFDRVETSHSSVTLVSELADLKAGGVVWLALHMEPKDGWHTYWKNPGDSGAATRFDWDAPGFQFAAALYPTPQALPYDPLLNYGYKGPSVLLVRAVAPASLKGPVTLTLDAEWLVCKVECIPQFGRFSLTLPVGTGARSEDAAALFANARAALPEPGYWGASLALNADYSELTIFLSDAEMADIANARYFPEAPGVADYAAPQVVEITNDGLLIRIRRLPGEGMPDQGDGVITLDRLDGSSFSAALKNVPVSELVIEMPAATGGVQQNGTKRQAATLEALFLALGGAFLGGILLNLMPCVFPVLSLKAFSIIKNAGLSSRDRQKEAWAYTAGIVASFALVVMVLLALRAGGETAGWGFQLQSPGFLVFLTLLMVILAVSMAGVFDFTTGVDDAGQGLAASGGLKGSFFTGVLTTLVATPCTGPFMGAAIGFAIAQPVPILSLIFLMLALGLAFPFLLFAYIPRAASLLPRPGAWMETLKKAMTFPLLLTACWLAWLFGGVMGVDALFQLMAACLGVVFAIWLAKQGQSTVLKGSALVLGLLMTYAAFNSTQQGQAFDTARDINGTEPVFSQALLDDATGGDQPVFAYFTASWCITCKVNERIALFREETKAHFQDKNVRLIKGDWTNKNAEIAALLERYGRVGVPLYLYFPAGSKDALVLPEILTVDLLKETVR